MGGQDVDSVRCEFGHGLRLHGALLQLPFVVGLQRHCAGPPPAQDPPDAEPTPSPGRVRPDHPLGASACPRRRRAAGSSLPPPVGHFATPLHHRTARASLAHEFDLERLEEAPRWCVAAACRPAHRCHGADRGKLVDVGARRILRSAIRVVDEARCWPLSLRCHQQGREPQLGSHVAPHRPPCAAVPTAWRSEP